MGAKSKHISPQEFKGFRDIQRKLRPQWWAVFSVNRHEQVWPFVCFKRTPEEDREYVRLEEYPLLKEVAQCFLTNVDEDGGRFFINTDGVFGMSGESETRGTVLKQFIEWRPDGPLSDCSTAQKPAPDSKISLQEMHKSMEERKKAALEKQRKRNPF